jgi:zinc transport system permease protein
MIQFIHDAARFPFLQYALATGVLSAVACGIVGSYVTVRRITYIAGAIAHSTLGGMGAARYLQRNLGWTFITPMHGAVFAALLAAIIIGLVSLYGKEREDTVLSAVWAIGMAIGIFFITRTAGYSEDLMSYLFGSILMVRRMDLFLIVGLDLVVVAASFLFYNQLEAVCFDEEFARLRGLKVEVYYILLLCLTALTIVTLLQVVGIVMVIALLSLPAATAAFLTRQLWQTILVAVLLNVIYMVGGLALSYGPNLPAGATIIILAGAVYIAIVSIGPAVRRRLRRVSSDGGTPGRSGVLPSPRRQKIAQRSPGSQ